MAEDKSKRMESLGFVGWKFTKLSQRKDNKEAPPKTREWLDIPSVPPSGRNSRASTPEPPPPLHSAAKAGDLKTIKRLLASKPPVGEEPWTRALDAEGRTPLICASLPESSRSIEAVKLLLQTDQQDKGCRTRPPLVNLVDQHQKASALHYACQSEDPELVRTLLEGGADSNLQNDFTLTPLHILATCNTVEAVECAKLILASSSSEPQRGGVSVISPPLIGTPLHSAVTSSSPKMLQFLIEQEGFDPGAVDTYGYTCLMSAIFVIGRDTTGAAAADQNSQVVSILLKASSKEQVNARNECNNGQTALMMAAYQANARVLKILLADPKTDLFVRDSSGRTVFHWAVFGGYHADSLECVKLLCESDRLGVSLFNKYLFKTKDAAGLAPIQYVLDEGYTGIAKYLLATFPQENEWMKNGPLMENIYSRLPTVMLPVMGASLSYHRLTTGQWNGEVDVDFGPITGSIAANHRDDFGGIQNHHQPLESRYLYMIKSAPQEVRDKMLSHPLVEIFLDLKWERMRWLTWIAIALQFAWILVYTLLVFEMVVPGCGSSDNNNASVPVGVAGGGGGKSNSSNSNGTPLRILLSLGFIEWEESCRFNQGAARLLALALYFLSACLLVKEAFQLRMKSTQYFRTPVNYFQLYLLGASLLNSLPAWQTTLASDVPSWQIRLAASGNLIAWTLALREVDKFPRCGIYFAILRRVFWSCLKMLAIYLPILVGFALCFRYIFPDKGQYKYFIFGLIKVVVMMTGELDFDGAFYDENGGGPSLQHNAIIGQLVFLLFGFVTTIVLLNLLTGFAVNDVQTIMERADLTRLANQLEQIYLLECFILELTKKRLSPPKMDEFKEAFCKFVTGERCSQTQILDTNGYSPELKAKIRKMMGCPHDFDT